MHAYILKGRSIWQLPILQSYNWSWRKLLKMRPLAYDLVNWENRIASWNFPRGKHKATAVWSVIRPRKENVELVPETRGYYRHFIFKYVTLYPRTLYVI